MRSELKQKVLDAAEYIENGDPMKDGIDEDEIMDVIIEVAIMIEDGQIDTTEE